MCQFMVKKYKKRVGLGYVYFTQKVPLGDACFAVFAVYAGLFSRS